MGEPELIDKYEIEKVSFEKADKAEWAPIRIDDEYSYISDFFHNDKEGYFLRVYKGTDMVYEEISEDIFFIEDVAYIGTSIYLFYKQAEKTNKYPSYLIRLDEDFNKEIIFKEYDYSYEKIIFNENSFFLLKRVIDTQIQIMEERTYSNKLLRSRELDKSFSFLYENNGILYFKMIEDDYMNVYRFSFENGLELFYIGLAYALCYIQIEDDLLTYVSKRYASNGTEIWYYNGKEFKCVLKIPNYYENLSYYSNCLIAYHNHIFISVHATIQGGMSFYNRVFIFHYDEKNDKITVIYLDKNYNQSFIKNNKFYLGRYYSENNDTSDGDFYAVNLDDLI